MRLLTIAIAVVHCLASTAFHHLAPRHQFAYSLFLRRKEQRRPDVVAVVDSVDKVDKRFSVNSDSDVGFSLDESARAIGMIFDDCCKQCASTIFVESVNVTANLDQMLDTL
jgi:hypothetical protein